MIKFLLTIIFLGTISFNIVAQKNYGYGLTPTTFKQYKASIIKNPQKELINLEKFIPNIVLDIRYSTTNNFTKEKIYNLSRAYARKPVAEALKRAQEELSKQSLG